MNPVIHFSQHGWLTKTGFSKMFRLSQHLTNQLIDENVLPILKIGRVDRIYRKEIADFYNLYKAGLIVKPRVRLKPISEMMFKRYIEGNTDESTSST